MCGVNLGAASHDGYVPDDLGIGGGDYVEFDYCLDCGQLQGKFPLPPANIEKNISDEEVVEFFNNHFAEGSYFNNVRPNIQNMMVDHASEVSVKLGKFVRNYIDYNMTLHPHAKHPSATKFVEMFRNSDYQL
jgi:hypothetical protein